jgi:hypothetical protein
MNAGGAATAVWHGFSEEFAKPGKPYEESRKSTPEKRTDAKLFFHVPA